VRATDDKIIPMPACCESWPLGTFEIVEVAPETPQFPKDREVMLAGNWDATGGLAPQAKTTPPCTCSMGTLVTVGCQCGGK
jgi:hypothetical protein